MPTLAYSPRSRSGQNWMRLKKPLAGVMTFLSYIEFGLHDAPVHQHRSNPRPQERGSDCSSSSDESATLASSGWPYVGIPRRPWGRADLPLGGRGGSNSHSITN